ncbi:hypothetical protein BGZ76_005236 [Entomortierella beljakovae]|nr:hypothetical protein BGZ76_005236 [Entomortierella beljakovae]
MAKPTTTKPPVPTTRPPTIRPTTAPPRTTTAPPRTTTVAPPKPSTTVATSANNTSKSSSATTTKGGNASSTSTSSTPTINSVGIGAGSGDSGMGGGAVAGLVIGILVVLVGSVVGGFFLLKQRRKRLMLVGRNTRNNGYPEPDLDRPIAPFRREGPGSRPGSGYNSQHGSFGSHGGRRYNGESGNYDEKSYHAAAAGLGGPRVNNNSFVGSHHSNFGNDSFTQLSDGTYVATGRRDGDKSPTSPMSLGSLSPGAGERKERVQSYMSDDFNLERQERERELDRQQQERLLMLAGEDLPSPRVLPSPGPGQGGPYGYPHPYQQAFRGHHPGGSGDLPHFNRPNSYHPHPYQQQQHQQHQHPYMQSGAPIQRPYTQYYPQQQQNYPFPPPITTGHRSPNLRPMAQHPHGTSSVSVHSSYGYVNPSQTSIGQTNEKQEIDDSSDMAASVQAAPLSSTSPKSPGSESTSSPNTAIASPVSDTARSVQGRTSQEQQTLNLAGNNSTVDVENLKLSTVGVIPISETVNNNELNMQRDPSVTTDARPPPPPLPNLTKPK